MNVDKISYDVSKRIEYIYKCPLGTIVAFKCIDEDGDRPDIYKSGKVVKKFLEQELIEVITEYGARFYIPFRNVVWVKTGTRWPRKVYNLLKGK